MGKTVKFFYVPPPPKYCGGRIVSDGDGRGAHCERCGQKFPVLRIGSNCAMKNRGKKSGDL